MSILAEMDNFCLKYPGLAGGKGKGGRKLLLMETPFSCPRMNQTGNDLLEVPSQNLLTAESTAVLDGVAQGCR